LPRLVALLLLAGMAEALVVAWRAARIADVESWWRLGAAAFEAGVTRALFLLPALLLLEFLATAIGRWTARRAGGGAGRLAAAVLWSAGGLGGALWLMSWTDSFRLAPASLPLAAAALALLSLALLARFPRAWPRRAAGATALLAVAGVVALEVRTAFGQYPNFHVAAQWLVLLVAGAALGALGPLPWPRRLDARRSFGALAAGAALVLPLHWGPGALDGERALVRGLGWMTLPQEQLFHPASLNPPCEGGQGTPRLPPEARAEAFLRYANFEPLPRDLEGRNLVLVVVDALRADRVGAIGGTRGLTPNLDTLATRSVVFENAYASSSGTIGTLGALFCMAPPSWMEITTEKIFWRGKLGVGCRTLAERLAARGYRTRASIYYYVAGTLKKGSGYLRGFESVSKGKSDLEVVRGTLADLEEEIGKRNGPSFTWLQLAQTHEPYTPAPEFPPAGPTEEARYDAAVRSVDAAIGALVQGFDRLGLWRDTVLIVLSDHGEEFGDHGGRHHNRTVYDEMLRVPLIVRDPRVTPRRLTADVVASDLAAWLLWEHRGAPDPEVVGRVASAAGMLYGTLGDVRIAELLSNTGIRVALIRGPRKAIRNLASRTDELYDRAADPGERHNLAGSAPQDDLLRALDRYERLRNCTRRAHVEPIWGGESAGAL
jgi:arylsulfatase A-like enzyme